MTPDTGVAGLDLGLLQRMATDFFQAAPGGHSDPGAPQRPSPGISYPSVPATNITPAGSVLAAEALPVAPPSTYAPVSAPRESNAGAGLAQNVPMAYAAALPAVAAPSPGGASPSAVDSSPFYFLADKSGPSDDLFIGGLARQGLGLDQVSVQAFAMPGQEGLAKIVPASGPAQASPGGHPAAASPEPRFSFLETVNAAASPKIPQLPVSPASVGLLDVHAVRRDFPILSERVNGKPLIWFDNAATTQKPQAVIDRIAHFYAHENSNIHRAAHELAARATDAYESARQKVADYIGAKSAGEIIFVRGATEAINLVARTYGRQEIGEGDEIIVSHLEHHANIVPWQMLADNKRARLRVIPVDDSGQIRLDEYRKLLGPKTKLVAVTQVSNALGTVTPITEIVAMAHAAGAKVLVDGAQSVSHMRVNVQALDADFFVFSGHKVFAPTGIGVVYGKRELLDRMPPWQGGGNMIADVTFEQTIYNPPPGRFEAGTGNIADAVGLGAALDYVQRIGLERIYKF
jgi:cysteine desulfurase/selenocysteine lyase